MGADEAEVTNTQEVELRVLACFRDTPKTGEEGRMKSKMAAHMCPDVKTGWGRRWWQKRRVVTAGRLWALHVTPLGLFSRYDVFQ